ncbi:zinc finger protein 567-like isoform X2 [Danaus plexippus]|uniref:zinc finger protein 567-like isoform X2 n=1 Tax=Danaus plexippus TaxID=13037 RepID=UPI002AB17E2D|nr:zinc finger protein 567-like isoform X2 [Danaus plexippus]
MSLTKENTCNICLSQTQVFKYDVSEDEILSQIPLLKNLELNSLCSWCEATLKKISSFLNLVQESQRILNNPEEIGSIKRNHPLIHTNEFDVPAFNEVYLQDGVYEDYYSENKSDKNIKKRRMRPKQSMQFTVKHLSLDEQREEIELKKGSPEYTERNYKCKDCGLGFISEDVFEEHIVKHSESNGANMCDVCTLRFKSKTVLTQHKLLHSRVFVCNKCGVHIKKWSHALTHRHKCWDVCVSVCVYCKKVFNNKNSLDVHIRGVHKNIKKYVCVECKRLFGTKQRLRVHMRSHTGSKPFVCDCGRKFTTKSNLKSHQNVHSSSREHYCVECNRYYKTERGLKKHYKDTLKHGGDGAVPRSQCDDKFHSETAVSSHVRVRHSTEYTCGVCNKNYSSNSNLRKHLRSVHNLTDIDIA